MKNSFFQEMQRAGIKYRKGKLTSITTDNSNNRIHPPYSEGQSFAYKFWAIADRYNSNEVLIDDLPVDVEISIMLETFSCADINEIVVKEDRGDIVKRLEEFGCIPICKCKVFRRETILYQGELEIIKGIMMRIYEQNNQDTC